MQAAEFRFCVESSLYGGENPAWRRQMTVGSRMNGAWFGIGRMSGSSQANNRLLACRHKTTSNSRLTRQVESLLMLQRSLSLLASTEAQTFGHRERIRAHRNPWHARASGQTGSLCDDDSRPRSQTIHSAQDRTK